MTGDRVGGVGGNVLRTLREWLRARRGLFLFLFLMLLAIWLCRGAFRVARGFFESHRVKQVALGDVDNDGDLDAFMVNGYDVHEAYVLMNDGSGRFGRGLRGVDALDRWPGDTVALGDVNGDGYADAFLGLVGGGIVRYLNDGAGHFPDWEYLTRPGSTSVAHVHLLLGDLNGNGRLDIFAARCCGRRLQAGEADRVGAGDTGEPILSYSQVWLYDTDGRPAEGYKVGHAGSNGAALADLNGDGTLDVFLANGRTMDIGGNTSANTPNTVLFNDGQGHLTDSGQRLGQSESMAVALANVNGDGFVDAAVGNRGADAIWLNDGRGFFGDSGQRLGSGLTEQLFLGALDGDEHVDLLALGESGGRVWLNDGTGRFAPAQTIGYGPDAAPTVGDVTGDGQTDLFAADTILYRVWRGDGNGRFSPTFPHAYR